MTIVNIINPKAKEDLKWSENKVHRDKTEKYVKHLDQGKHI